jgi:SAM-dependent methyltransferase
VNRIDRVLQDWRIRRAAHWIPQGARVLDVGCFDARLFRRLGDRLDSGVGVDPLLPVSERDSMFTLLREPFPSARVPGPQFDVITMLAVLEHLEASELVEWSRAARDLLRPGGLVVATVPSPAVDGILRVLIRLRIVDGMEVDQHHGAEPEAIVDAFASAGFAIVESKRFQFGLNNLFVLRKPHRARSDLAATTCQPSTESDRRRRGSS